MKAVRVDPDAEEEIAAAIEWYDRKRPGLGAEFLDEIAIAASGNGHGSEPVGRPSPLR